jgi:hypothetical protein
MGRSQNFAAAHSRHHGTIAALAGFARYLVLSIEAWKRYNLEVSSSNTKSIFTLCSVLT